MAEKEPVEIRAGKLVRDGDRQIDYGHPREHWDRVAELWSVIFGKTVTGRQAVLAMVALKTARLLHTPAHEDSLVDLIGYAIVYDRCGEPYPEDWGDY